MALVRKATLACLLLAMAASFAACSASPAGPVSPTPGQIGATTPAVVATSAAMVPTPETAKCESDATFLEDLTLPDGSEVAPGAELEKRWRVRNNGTCDWGAGYRLEPLADSPFADLSTVALFPARSGADAVWSISLAAPKEAGEYLGRWQAVDPEGQAFGEVVYLQIEVGQAETTPTPTGTP
jgi:hypothetical protein